MVSLQERIARRLRHSGVGGRAAVFEWQSGDVRRVLCGRDAVPCGDCQTAAPGGDLSCRDGVELSRRLDLPGRRIRTVVQRVVVQRTGAGYDAAALGERNEPIRRQQGAAAGFLPFDGGAFCGGHRAVLHGLAGASQLRQLLEADFD